METTTLPFDVNAIPAKLLEMMEVNQAIHEVVRLWDLTVVTTDIDLIKTSTVSINI